MSKPSVTRTFNSTIFPLLAAIGFKRFGGKKYVRFRGDIAQFLFLHVESRMKREFMLEYSTILLCEPHDSFCLDPGGRFPGGSGRWYPAADEERLTKSVSAIAEILPKTLLVWCEGCIDIDGFINTYSDYLTQHTYLQKNGHSMFRLACANAKSGNLRSATENANSALGDYEGIFQENADCKWAMVGADHCRRLLENIRTQTLDSLFSQWREFTIANLKLQSALEESTKG